MDYKLRYAFFLTLWIVRDTSCKRPVALLSSIRALLQSENIVLLMSPPATESVPSKRWPSIIMARLFRRQENHVDHATEGLGLAELPKL
jgi:hypothetical protein